MVTGGERAASAAKAVHKCGQRTHPLPSPAGECVPPISLRPCKSPPIRRHANESRGPRTQHANERSSPAVTWKIQMRPQTSLDEKILQLIRLLSTGRCTLFEANIADRCLQVLRIAQEQKRSNGRPRKPRPPDPELDPRTPSLHNSEKTRPRFHPQRPPLYTI